MEQQTLPIFPTPDVVLWEGDCLEVMLDIEDGSIDMVMADPPYGTTACKWDSIIPLEPMWKELKRVIKPKGAIVLTASQPFTTTLISSNIGMFKYALVWSKKMASGFVNAKRQPMKAHEDILIFGNNIVTYNPQMTKRTALELKRLAKKSVGVSGSEHYHYMETTSPNRIDNLYKYPNSIINITGVMNRSKEKVSHPTQKPVALMEYLIKTYSNEGDTVLDFCMGSGTTGVACKNLNRNFIGIEKDPKYFKIARERIAKERKI